MKLEELMAAASQETSCLRYYGSAQKNPNSEETTRLDEPFNDACFYDRLIGIGYTKVVMTLSKRCVPHFVTSKNPVLNSSIEELEVISGPRNHNINVYTPLEYAFALNIEGAEKLREKLRS
jgi:hypothetical protein